MGYKKQLEFAKLKVVEEASELINELIDSMTKEDKDNYEDIILECADLKVRLDLLTELFQEKDSSFVRKVSEAYHEKMNKISIWHKERKYKNA